MSAPIEMCGHFPPSHIRRALNKSKPGTHYSNIIFDFLSLHSECIEECFNCSAFIMKMQSISSCINVIYGWQTNSTDSYVFPTPYDTVYGHQLRSCSVNNSAVTRRNGMRPEARTYVVWTNDASVCVDLRAWVMKQSFSAVRLFIKRERSIAFISGSARWYQYGWCRFYYLTHCCHAVRI